MKILKTKTTEAEATESDIEEVIISAVNDLIYDYSDDYNIYSVQEVLSYTLDEHNIVKYSDEEFDKLVTMIQNKYSSYTQDVKVAALHLFDNRKEIIKWINRCQEALDEDLLSAEEILDAILENGKK